MKSKIDQYQYVSSAKLPTHWGKFHIHGFIDNELAQEHIALSYGQWDAEDIVPIRIHSECLTGDALFSTRCDCGAQLQKALENIVQQGKGVLLYLRQEGRGIGLLYKIRDYQLKDEGIESVEASEHLGFDADIRDYGICKLMLHKLKINNVNLMTNNPKKVLALSNMGINVAQRTPIDHGITDDNRNYIRTKTEKLGHQFDKALLK
jgi:GTP cyclohydrolase II